MQRRILGNEFVLSYFVLYVVTIFLLGLGLYCDYMCFTKEAAEWLTEGGILIFLAGTAGFIWFNLMVAACLWFSLDSLPSFFGKVRIDESGVRATAFSRTTFRATWEELEDIGIILGRAAPLVAAEAVELYFSKCQLNLLTKGELYALSKLHVDSDHVLIRDLAENILKSELLMHIPLERLVWHRGEDCSTETFLKWKFALTRQKEE